MVIPLPESLSKKRSAHGHGNAAPFKSARQVNSNLKLVWLYIHVYDTFELPAVLGKTISQMQADLLCLNISSWPLHNSFFVFSIILDLRRSSKASCRIDMHA